MMEFNNQGLTLIKKIESLLFGPLAVFRLTPPLKISEISQDF